MNEEEKSRLSELLGPGFSDAELEKLLRDHPDLAREIPWMRQRMSTLREGKAPELGEAFTRRVMENLDRPHFWKDLGEAWLNWRRLFLAGSLAAAALAGVILVPRYFSAPLSPMAFREDSLPGAGRTYRVGFKIRLPEARSVALAGDFTQWNAVELTPSPQGDGTFALEMPLSAGTYAYAFLVDGKKWVPDPTVTGRVEDGFGNYNSLLNL